MLHNELSVVVVPPGTGKSTTGAIGVGKLAQNADGPILVTAPSNFAILCTKRSSKSGKKPGT